MAIRYEGSSRPPGHQDAEDLVPERAAGTESLHARPCSLVAFWLAGSHLSSV